MARFLAVLLCVVALASAACCQTKNVKQAVGPCNMEFHVKGCKGGYACMGGVTYDVEARDLSSGMASSTVHGKDATQLSETSLVDLLNKMNPITSNPSQVLCNCVRNHVPVGKCQFEVTGCFYFNDTAAVGRKQETFKCQASYSGLVVPMSRSANAESACAANVQQWGAAHPAQMGACLSEYDREQHVEVMTRAVRETAEMVTDLASDDTRDISQPVVEVA